ncbi:transcriptional repressor [Peptostreptococcus russellii]|nr:Fur family transcriptional regulator [Peptostreptococcus russellii]MBC2577557.1 transcriptional repressor [Peptostreptococcus russellii]
MENTMSILKEKLKATGFKITPQRRAIIEVLIENENSHLSSEEIYDKVRVNCPEIGLATVYRTMQLLDDINGISKLNLDDGCIRYELNLEGEDTHHHHHLICKECGSITEVKEDLLEEIESKVEDRYNFRIKDHDLKFYGLCESCASKGK